MPQPTERREYGMPFRKVKTFTDEEWIAAMALILPPDQAREQGLAFSSLPEYTGYEDATREQLRELYDEGGGPISYDSDLLDLLSLVSDDCAERAWRLLGVSRDEGEERRKAIRARVEEAQRYRDAGA